MRNLYQILCGKGIFNKEEFLEMVNAVNLEIGEWYRVFIENV